MKRVMVGMFILFTLLFNTSNAQWAVVSPTKVMAVNNDLFTTGTSGVYRSTDNGDSWFYIGLKPLVVTSLTSDGVTLLATTNAGAFKTEARTAFEGTWNSVVDTLLGKTGRIYNMVPRGSFIFGNVGYTGANGHDAMVLKTSDLGRTWMGLVNGPVSRDMYVNYLKSGNGAVFVSKNNGFSPSVVARSIDGETWVTVATANKAPFPTWAGGPPFGFTPFTVNDSTILLCASGYFGNEGIYYSTNLGSTWSKVSTAGLPTVENSYPQSWTISSSVVHDSDMFVTMSALIGRGVYHFNTTDSVWVKITASDFLNVCAITDNYVYAHDSTGMTYKYSLGKPTTLRTAVVNVPPTKFIMLQNFPNPFNPTTTIEYVVDRYGPVKLSVVDILGRETILVNETQSVGSYRYTWTSTVSGTYFAVLKTVEKQSAIRMSAIK